MLMAYPYVASQFKAANAALACSPKRKLGVQIPKRDSRGCGDRNLRITLFYNKVHS